MKPLALSFEHFDVISMVHKSTDHKKTVVDLLNFVSDVLPAVLGRQHGDIDPKTGSTSGRATN